MTRIKIKTTPKRAAALVKAMSAKPKIMAESSTKVHDELTNQVMIGFLQTMQDVMDVLKNG